MSPITFTRPGPKAEGARLRIVVCVLLAALLLAVEPCGVVGPRPRISRPAATIAGEPIVLAGEGFGLPGPEQWLLLRSGMRIIRILSTDPEVERWEPEFIVAHLPPDARSGTIRVKSTGGFSARVNLDVFAYEWFDIPRTPGTNALPLDLVLDAESIVWVHQQFSLRLHSFEPLSGAFRAFSLPRTPTRGPFASRLHGGPTRVSALGEKILVDPEGRIWLTQGGGAHYFAPFPNHSRIVRFDPFAPESERFRVYNVPGDKNEVIGLLWDAVHNRMWFSQAGFAAGAALVSFDPDRLPFDNHFDFAAPLDHLVCAPGEPGGECYRFYWLPDPFSYPAHLLQHEDGHVWYTNFWGNSIGRLDPETGETDEYPLPPTISDNWASLYVGCGPWRILAAPNGDIVINEFFDSTLSRFKMDRLGDPACLVLDESGRNPCIDEIVVPGADLAAQAIHSIAYDPDGNLWFTECSDVDSDSSLGFVTPDWEHVVRLPPLSHFQADGIPYSAGIAIDQETGEIWFAEFHRKRIGHLFRLE